MNRTVKLFSASSTITVELFSFRYSQGIRVSNSKTYVDGHLILLTTSEDGSLCAEGQIELAHELRELAEEGNVKVWEINGTQETFIFEEYTFQDTVDNISAIAERQWLENIIRTTRNKALRLTSTLYNADLQDEDEADLPYDADANKAKIAGELVIMYEAISNYTKQLNALPYVEYRADLSIIV
jgi:hypothetical protein